MEWRRGATVGKKLLGLKAISNGGRPLKLRSVVVRRAWLLTQLIPIGTAGAVLVPVAAVVTLASIAF